MSRHDVAVKVLDAHLAGDAVAQARFRLVARTVVQLSGPGITPVHEYGEAALPDGLALPYLVRDLVGGQTLEQRLAQGPLSAGEALHVVAAVAGALAAAHRAGVPHGHLAPANIVLGPDGVQVTDFGLWGLRQPPESDYPAGLSYAAPELALGGAATPAADMYALGIVFIACLAGIGPGTAGAADAGDRAAPPGAGDAGTGDAATVRAAGHDGEQAGPAQPGGSGGTAFGATALDAVPPGLAALWAACLGPGPMERPSAAHAAVMSRQMLPGGRAADGWAAAADQAAVPLDQPAWLGPSLDHTSDPGTLPAGPAPPAQETGAVPAGTAPDAGAVVPPGVPLAAASAAAGSAAAAGPPSAAGSAAVAGSAAAGSSPAAAAGERRARRRHALSRPGRVVTAGAVTGTAAAAVVVAVLASSLGGRPVTPGSLAHITRASSPAGAQPSSGRTGEVPTPEVTRSVLASTPPSTTPAPPLTPLAAVSQVSRTITADVAAGQLRQDVAVDFGNLIRPVADELEQGQQAPVAQLAVALRARLWTRVSEGAVTVAAASVLNDEITALARSAG